MLGLAGTTVSVRTFRGLPGCPVWMFITVYDHVIYLRCLLSNKKKNKDL